MAKRKTAVQEYLEEEIPQERWANYLEISGPERGPVRRIDVMRSMEEAGHTQKEISDWMFFMDCRMEKIKKKTLLSS